MGAGAGYTITVENCKFTSIDTFIPVGISDYLLEIDCVANIMGDIKSESYYHGCPFVVDVPMVVTHMAIDFCNMGTYYYKADPDMFTPEAVDRILGEYNGEYDDFSSIYIDDEFLSKLTINDFNLDYFKQTLLSSYYSFGGASDLGGGWVHSTFGGVFTIENDSGFYADESFTIEIPDKFVVKYLDKVTTGDNVIYDIIFNGDVIDGTDDGDEAIDALKGYIQDAIAKDGPEAVDFSDCYVEEVLDILLNGIGESDIDADYPYTVYKAEEDSEFAKYVEEDYGDEDI